VNPFENMTIKEIDQLISDTEHYLEQLKLYRARRLALAVPVPPSAKRFANPPRGWDNWHAADILLKENGPMREDDLVTLMIDAGVPLGGNPERYPANAKKSIRTSVTLGRFYVDESGLIHRRFPDAPAPLPDELSAKAKELAASAPSSS
jgi:hypothetical protein